MTDLLDGVIPRLLAQAEFCPSTGCWLWTGSSSGYGYGMMKVGGRRGRIHYVHRLSFEYFRGPIPLGYQVDHLCRVRCCVNPSHLEAVPPTVNRRRQIGTPDDGLHCRKGRACHTEYVRRRRAEVA